MDLQRLHEILDMTTIFYRSSQREFVELAPGVEVVDLELVSVAVSEGAANILKAELIKILDTYPQLDRLKLGPSYIEVGAVIGDQGAAFRLFALGKVLGLWDIITPSQLSKINSDEKTRELGGLGLVMISGYYKL